MIGRFPFADRLGEDFQRDRDSALAGLEAARNTLQSTEAALREAQAALRLKRTQFEQTIETLPATPWIFFARGSLDSKESSKFLEWVSHVPYCRVSAQPASIEGLVAELDGWA